MIFNYPLISHTVVQRSAQCLCAAFQTAQHSFTLHSDNCQINQFHASAFMTARSVQTAILYTISHEQFWLN